MIADETLPLNGTPALMAGPAGYSLLHLLGRGGGGAVWEARDRNGNPVALKFISRHLNSDRQRAGTEVAALRWLQVPGVVRFLDEGEEPDRYWIAMELVAGSPFPGSRETLSWESLAPMALQLLQILAQVHHAGVLHRDLKPGNVFVGPTGRVTLLDFGIAWGDALSGERRDAREGTQTYLAPECKSGSPPGRSTDLYAAGIMFRQVLTGQREGSAPLPAGLPPAVADMLDRMISPDRRQRPQTAEDAAFALGSPPRHLHVAEPLEELFHGPRHYLHLPQRGAERLRQLSGGDLSRVPGILHAWEQQAVGHWVGERIKLDRVAVAEWGGREEEELARRLLSGESHAQLYKDSLATVRRLMDEAQVERALRLCERALELGPGTEELGLLAAEAATRLESLAALNRAICLTRRCPSSPTLQTVDQLLRASELVLNGRRTEALARLEGDTDPLPEPLEIWRMAMYMLSLEGLPEEEEALGEAGVWAQSPRRHARWQGWKGNFFYRKQNYLEAAQLHEASVHTRQTLDSRLAAQRAAAAAWMELGELERAQLLATEVREGAARIGQPAMELRADWVARSAAWRRGQPFPPDWERIEAAAMVVPSLAGLLALTDAAVARAQNQTYQAIPLAKRSEELLGLRHPRGAALAGCLRISLEGGSVEEAEGLAAVLRSQQMPSLLVQGLALLSERWPGRWSSEIAKLLPQLPSWREGERREVLRYEDCRAQC